MPFNSYLYRRLGKIVKGKEGERRHTKNRIRRKREKEKERERERER